MYFLLYDHGGAGYFLFAFLMAFPIHRRNNTYRSAYLSPFIKNVKQIVSDKFAVKTM